MGFMQRGREFQEVEKPQMHIEMSIDKVSFTAKVASAIDKTGLNDYLSNPAIESNYFKSDNFLYQHNFKFPDGSFFQYGTHENIENARLEFNPNKCDLEVIQKIIARLKHPKVTRIDWAIDYHDVDFSKYKIRDLVGRKEIKYRSRSKKLETYYIGSNQSDNFIRIYNKALERLKAKRKIVEDVEEEIKVKRSWWRVEAVSKDFSELVEKELESFIEHTSGELKGQKQRVIKKEKVKVDGNVFQNPFECIEVYEKVEECTEGMKMAEKAMLFYLKYNPDEWENLSPKTAKKYEQLQYSSSYELIYNQPKEIFEKEKSKLAMDLYSVLKPAIDNGKYLTGVIPNIEYSMDFIKKEEEENGGKKHV